MFGQPWFSALPVMMDDSMLLLVIAIIFCATFIRSTFGFGEALVAVPLLALIMPIDIAAPVAVLVSITVALVAVVQDRHHVAFREAGVLFASTCVGIPIGLWLLTAVPEHAVKLLLGIVIIAFSAFCLLRKKPAILTTGRSAPVFGFLAGILGGAYGMNGPPLVVYGTLSRWEPQQFRATLQAYFLPASIVVMLGYWLAGLWVSTVTRYYLLTLPVVVIAIFAGRSVNRAFRTHTFIACVHIGLVVVGLALLWQAYA